MTTLRNLTIAGFAAFAMIAGSSLAAPTEAHAGGKHIGAAILGGIVAGAIIGGASRLMPSQAMASSTSHSHAAGRKPSSPDMTAMAARFISASQSATNPVIRIAGTFFTPLRFPGNGPR
ncbi:MAG: hypothetical protein R3D29_11315 [Nitratireductor sp.]